MRSASVELPARGGVPTEKVSERQHRCPHMATKTIRVREAVHERLETRELPGESFSELLDRLMDSDVEFEQGFGALDRVDFDGALAALDE